MLSLEYWFVFPCAVLVAILANASGFSGGVLFQPFFNFALALPLPQSIATGIATETIGMSSGASRYWLMKQIDSAAVKKLLPLVAAGVLVGLFVFVHVPRDGLRLIVGGVVSAVALHQLFLAWRGRLGTRSEADLAALGRFRWRAFFAGSFSACTGTGVAELSQPLLEQKGGLATKRANATAIALEALADWGITLVNLSLGYLRFDILVFSASGVLIGGQLGAWISPSVPDRLLKTLFALCVLGIGTVYVLTAGQALLGLSCNGSLESAMTEQREEGAHPSHPERPAVAVRDLWMTFPGPYAGKEVHVLERINMEVARGEFVCLVGPSGCGKTTLLNLIAGFLPATRGEVLVEGAPVHGPDPRRIFIFQEGGIFPWLTVRDNVGFGLAQKSKAERERIVAHYLDMVGLTGFEGAYPRELSGGMRQRVEIARALAAGPDIIYMDEPFGALDYFTRWKMRADLVRIWEQERKTVLFVTHDIDEAIQLADRVVVLGPRPAAIQLVVPIDQPRPRDPDAPSYLQTRARILAAMGIGLRNGTGLTEGAANPVVLGPALELATGENEAGTEPETGV